MALPTHVAVVTGAAKGIGYGVSEQLLQSPYRVCLIDINEVRGKQAESRLQSKYGSENVIFFKCDVSSKDEFTAAVEKIIQLFGRIDLLVNNAGIVDENEPSLTVAVNLVGSIYGCKLALEYMGTDKRRVNGGNGGTVINVSSISGLLPFPESPAYVSTKHALIGLTRSYGHKDHLDKDGVFFMAVCPHNTETPILQGTKRRLSMLISPDKDVVTMSVEKVVQGVMKLLKDKLNGSTLLVLPDRSEYVEIPENLRAIPTIFTMGATDPMLS